MFKKMCLLACPLVAAGVAYGVSEKNIVVLDEVVCNRLVVGNGENSCVIEAHKDGVYMWMTRGGPGKKPAIGIYNTESQGAVVGLWSKAWEGKWMNFAVSTQGDEVNIQTFSGKNGEKLKFNQAENLVFGK